MRTLLERIEEVMEAASWDVQQTAGVAGVSRSAVAQWLGQGSKTIHSIGRVDAAERRAAASGYNALWIALGKGEKSPERAKWLVDKENPMPP